MSTELTTALASEIRDHHEAAELYASAARTAAENAVRSGAICGNNIEQAKIVARGRLLGWLRDNVPNLTPEKAKAYMSLAGTLRARECQALDHRQYLLAGIIDAKDAKVGESKPGGGKGPKLAVWAGSIRAYFESKRKTKPIEEWSKVERENIVDQMRPIVEMYRQIERTLGDSDFNG